MTRMARQDLMAAAATFALLTGGQAPARAPAAAAAQAAPAAQPQAAPRLNVLFIMADDLAPRTGSYGAAVSTPNLDALARSGVQFEQAYCQFPWCAPSRASMLTGTRPDTTRVMDLNTPFRRALPDIQTLPQYFRNHGYRTTRVGKIFHQGVPGEIGTGGPDDPQSWDEVANPRGRDRDAENGRLKNNSPGVPYGSAMAWLDDEGADEEQTDGMVATNAIAMLRANAQSGQPFFLAVGFYRPHVPLVAPKAYFRPYALEKMKVAAETPESLARVPDYTKAWNVDNFGMNERQQREIIRAYSASTSYMDSQVGRVLKELRALGLDKNTVIVFASDHGYLLGEHGQWMKNVLWNQSTRVPLIISAPGVASAKSARTVELVDLYPTLTDLAGLPHYSRNEGTSLVPLLKHPKRAWDRPALSQVRGGRSVTTARWRYTEWEEGKLGVELYDHRSDPGEHRNLAGLPKYAKVIAQLRAKLPKGPVEKRAPPARYDPVRGCMPGSASAAPRPAAPPGAAGGDGPGGLVQCQRLDP